MYVCRVRVCSLRARARAHRLLLPRRLDAPHLGLHLGEPRRHAVRERRGPAPQRRRRVGRGVAQREAARRERLAELRAALAVERRDHADAPEALLVGLEARVVAEGVVVWCGAVCDAVGC